MPDDTAYFFEWLEHPTYDDYWRRWSIDEDYGRLDVPALHVARLVRHLPLRHGQELRRDAGRRRAAEARAGQKLLIGPWTHMPGRRYAPGSAGRANRRRRRMQLRWFDQFLKGEDTGVPDAPVSLFVMGRGVARLSGLAAARFDTGAAGISIPPAAPTRVRRGTLSRDTPSDETPDVFTTDPLYPIRAQAGTPAVSISSPRWDRPTRAGREFNGSPGLHQRTAGATAGADWRCGGHPVRRGLNSAVDTDWTARLCEVFPMAAPSICKKGSCAPVSGESLTEPTLIEPDRVYSYEIPLGPVGVRIPPGNGFG